MICNICHHKCSISEGKVGFCKTKTLKGQKPVDLSYGEITAFSLDPIEKKPLAGYMPGSRILSISTWGCNMTCPWCQNDSISRGRVPYAKNMKPKDLAQEAYRLKAAGNIGIAYTYNEPLLNPEFILDTAKEIKNLDMKNVLVTNGMISEEYGEKLWPYIDALNIDLKTFSEDKYKKIGGDLPSVLRTIRTTAKSSHVEITMPLVPGFNDSYEEIDAIAAFIAETDPEIILHISRIFPAGDMPYMEPTKVDLVYEYAHRARRYLKNVRTGNC